MGKQAKHRTRNDVVKTYEQRSEGVQRYMPNVASVTIGNHVTSSNDILTNLRTWSAAEMDVAQKRAALSAALQVSRASQKEASAFLHDFDRYVTGVYGNSADVLAVFGIAVAKPRAKNSLTTAASTLKGAQTRKARRPAAPVAGPPVVLPSHAAPAAANGSAAAPANGPAPSGTKSG